MTTSDSTFTGDALHCPITRDFMSNPVRLGCGHNFEKEAIAHWFELGHKICPCGRREVDPDQITYNEVLALKIEKHVLEHPELLEDSELQKPDRDISVVKFALLSTESYVIDIDEDGFPIEDHTFMDRESSPFAILILSICMIAMFFFFSGRDHPNH